MEGLVDLDYQDFLIMTQFVPTKQITILALHKIECVTDWKHLKISLGSFQKGYYYFLLSPAITAVKKNKTAPVTWWIAHMAQFQLSLKKF